MIRTIVALFVLSGSLALPLGRGMAQSGDIVPLDVSLRKSIVLVRVTPVHYNQALPWMREPGRGFAVLGLVLPGKRILVLAHDIRNAALLEVTSYASYERSIAKVERFDLEANLALLSVENDAFFDPLLPLPAGEDPLPGSTVTAVKVDQVFRVYREEVQMKEINASADFGFTYLPVSVFRSSEPFQSGGVLLCEERHICGFIGYSDKEKRTESIPPSTFETFRKRAAGKSYAGFVAQGFSLGELVDPVQREYYGLSKDVRGALVTRVVPGTSAYGVLEPEDVLLSIDGVPVDDLGFYEDPIYGRQHALLLGNRDIKKKRMRVPGESVSVRVFRDGKVRKLSMTLKPSSGKAERIPWVVLGAPNYLVENGLLFLELSVPLVRQLFGKSWERKAVELAYIFNTQRFYEKPGEDRIVIIAGALPDPVNRGYEDIRASPVVKLDGKDVVNLQTLRKRLIELAKEGREFVSVELSGGRKIYLNLKDRDSINARINQRYQIPKSSPWD